ncbi:hypothetical protein [Nonomuraea sp. bgisy101]|uniref:hypothetical protein n=1 Tax=Nonomuraea sp. bgisy101 TaxID=3413784 RepID=UPI003D7547AF
MTCVPTAVLSMAVAQIWPLPWPCGADGSCEGSRVHWAIQTLQWAHQSRAVARSEERLQ